MTRNINLLEILAYVNLNNGIDLLSLKIQFCKKHKTIYSKEKFLKKIKKTTFNKIYNQFMNLNY